MFFFSTLQGEGAHPIFFPFCLIIFINIYYVFIHIFDVFFIDIYYLLFFSLQYSTCTITLLLLQKHGGHRVGYTSFCGSKFMRTRGARGWGVHSFFYLLQFNLLLRDTDTLAGTGCQQYTSHHLVQQFGGRPLT